MTTLTHTMTPVSSRSKSFGVTLFSAFSAYRRAMKTRNTLDALSDRELTDIGLTRGDIDAVAEGRFHRN